LNKRIIRDFELQQGIVNPAKIIMVTALSETEVVDDTFHKGADAYATKPLDIDKFIEVMINLKLIK